ncbi:PVC-type heme-binding CxxCH protein [Verrucomicrobiota bacterium sgz303538]
MRAPTPPFVGNRRDAETQRKAKVAFARACISSLRPLRLCVSAFFILTVVGYSETDRDDPAAELASFKLAEGFEANLFASEKDGVTKPIQMRWDARGRLWVIGSTTYPQIKPGEEPNDKVLILEDTDGDGRADKTTVFADGLMIPTGLEIAPTEKGSAVYVGEGTKLLLLRDTDGDNRADTREVVLRGFGTGDNHQNINSFAWSPGGELMFCQGLHAFSRVETPWGISALDEAGFWRLRPRQLRLDGFFGGKPDPQNPWGWTWTDWGQPLLVAGNNGGIFYPLPEMVRGHDQRRVGNIWVNARGRKTSGPDIVGTAHLPPEWQGTFITGGYINNAVWALKIEDDGAGFRMTDLQPLLTSTHTSFRPVDVKIGPDGAIYVCDWYNPIIGHYQASFRHPDRDKTHGRIWRITYKGRPLVKQPPVADAPIEQLLENLKSPERWLRLQSKRVLASRNTEDVTKALRAWWPRLDPDAADTEHALFEALGVFESHEALEPELLKRLLKAKTADARAYAVSTLGRWADRLPNDFDPVDALAGLAHDENPRVRLAAIVAAGNLQRPDSIVVALAAAEQPRDNFINSALQQSIVALKPQWQPQIAKAEQLGWKPSWIALLQSGDVAAAPVVHGPATDDKTRALMKDAAAGKSKGQLRATQEFVAELAKDVLNSGDAKRGAAVFRRAELACTACHSVGGQGGNIGPALDSIGSGQPLDFIIGAVLEPQREIKESYEAIELTMKDGQTLQGYLQREDGNELVIRDVAQNRETRLARAQISQRRNAGSLMPAGLVDQLSREDLRDLFRYLSELGKPR